MNPAIYSIIHVFSLLVLTGYTFHAFAAPAEARKKVMIVTGIASLLMLISGFGLLAKVYQNQFAPWVIVKLVCWLGLSALAGIGFRKRDKASVFIAVILALVFVALVSVYTKLAF
ncbi:MAG: SirB2 family protein [Verrucomicrobia bacterium]|nr:SirB2 family protein [Verrucomicrobiota bacterium]